MNQYHFINLHTFRPTHNVISYVPKTKWRKNTFSAFTLFERLEAKLDKHSNQLVRGAVELAKDWRTDKYLRKLEAMLIVADKDNILIVTGNGDVIEPEDDVAAIGSGGLFALSAARALKSIETNNINITNGTCHDYVSLRAAGMQRQ